MACDFDGRDQESIHDIALVVDVKDLDDTFCDRMNVPGDVRDKAVVGSKMLVRSLRCASDELVCVRLEAGSRKS